MQRSSHILYILGVAHLLVIHANIVLPADYAVSSPRKHSPAHLHNPHGV